MYNGTADCQDCDDHREDGAEISAKGKRVVPAHILQQLVAQVNHRSRLEILYSHHFVFPLYCETFLGEISNIAHEEAGAAPFKHSYALLFAPYLSED